MIELRPLAEISHLAFKTLYKEIGIVDTVRFINQFTQGYGDYTHERDQLFAEMRMEDWVAEIQRMKKERHGNS